MAGKGDPAKAEKDEREDSTEDGGSEAIIEDCSPTEPGRGCGRQLGVAPANEPKIEHGERDQENHQAA